MTDHDPADEENTDDKPSWFVAAITAKRRPSRSRQIFRFDNDQPPDAA